MEQQLAEKGFELHPCWEVGNTDVITRFLLQRSRASPFCRNMWCVAYLATGPTGQFWILECDQIVMWSQLVYHRKKYVTPQMSQFIEVLQKHIGG